MQPKRCRTLSIAPYNSATQVSLVHILEYIQKLREPVRPLDLPLLSDINLHHSLQKLVYGYTTWEFDFHKYLRHVPVMFGV